MTLQDDSLSGWGERLGEVSARLSADFPGESPQRQPVHTVCGGNLFSANTAARLGSSPWRPSIAGRRVPMTWLRSWAFPGPSANRFTASSRRSCEEAGGRLSHRLRGWLRASPR